MKTKYKVGDIVNTHIYGKGKIIEDYENLCNEEELIVKFYKPFYAGRINNARHAHQELHNIEIINKKYFL